MRNNQMNVARFRAKRRQERIVRLEIYAHAEDAKLIRDLANRLREIRSAKHAEDNAAS
jgi:hypothetical protein